MTPFLIAMVLIGTITDKKVPVAVFSVPGQESKAIKLGNEIQGWKLVQVEPKRATLQLGDKKQVIEIGQNARDLEVEEAVKIQGSKVVISSEMKEKLSGTNLVQTLMQTCSEPVPSSDGSLIGYKLSEIDSGSIYQIAGFIDGDIVTGIDNKPLDSPMNAMSALISVKNKEDFTINYLRGEYSKTLQISVQ